MVGSVDQDVTCYTAENMVARLWTTHFKTDEDVHAFFETMVTSRFVKNRWPRVWRRPPKLKIMHAMAYSKAWPSLNKIEMSLFACSDWDLIHELAHICDYRSKAEHGPKFYAIQLQLMGRFMSPEAARSLRYAYKALGVIK